MFCTPSEARVTVPVNFNGTIVGVKVTLCPSVSVGQLDSIVDEPVGLCGFPILQLYTSRISNHNTLVNIIEIGIADKRHIGRITKFNSNVVWPCVGISITETALGSGRRAPALLDE